MTVGESRRSQARVGGLREATGRYGWLWASLEGALGVAYDGEDECRGSELGVP